MFSVFQPFVFPGVRSVPLWGRVPDPVQHNLAFCNTTLQRIIIRQRRTCPNGSTFNVSTCDSSAGSEPVDHDAGVVIRRDARSLTAQRLWSGLRRARAPGEDTTRDETIHPPPDTVAGEETRK
jgi:hypothetical protein